MQTTKKITRKVSVKKTTSSKRIVELSNSIKTAANAVQKRDIERDAKFLNQYETVYEYITNQVKAPRKTLTNVEFKKFYHKALAKCPLLTCDKDRLCAIKTLIKCDEATTITKWSYNSFDGWYSIFYSIYVRGMKPKGF